MIAYPYFLSAFGLIVVIVGFILAGLSNSTPSRERGIHSKMRNEEILRHLRREQRIPFPNLVVAFGMICVLASIIWRLARYFV